MPDIVVLGATGFTGRLTSRYLSSHPQRGRFSWGIAARSKSKLDALVKDLSLPTDVEILQFNASDKADVERVVKSAKVVINTVGPFHRYGTPVVNACVRNAVHYLDLSGEYAWIRETIGLSDYAATKTGAIIVPACGFDSIPSDYSVYLSNKTLKAALEEAGQSDLDAHASSIKDSLSSFKLKSGVSGGTINSFFSTIDEVHPTQLASASLPYALSPAIGVPVPGIQALYRLAIPGEKPHVGGYWVMRSSNVAIVQRTFGLFEAQAAREKVRARPGTVVSSGKQRYGPLFRYDEFLVFHSAFKALLFSCSFFFAALLIVLVRPIRRLVQKYLPQPGEGPSDEEMKKGYLTVTNLTTSASNPPVQVKSVIKIKGDPSYLVTAVMISECALTLLLPPASANSAETTATYSALPTLPSLAQEGGVLTPVTAFGDVLLQRLQDTGLFEFSSSVIGEKQKLV